ncbi:MAG: outer membrane assembly protein BamE [Gammaproteobacteria bacterium]|nr:outer membrane assembly protein BamE [Gammaproteobacteria bacterium]|tara:strand:+ start:719 stop:1030 length:312 start_codon:yes stop_codon:yes gene_type:complete
MKKLLILIISLIMISCSNTSIYRVSITQGTVFKQEDINKLEVGMTKDQVIYVMGQPSFENFFEKNVWNYFYQIKSGETVDLERRLKLFFDDENLLSEINVIKI